MKGEAPQVGFWVADSGRHTQLLYQKVPPLVQCSVATILKFSILRHFQCMLLVLASISMHTLSLLVGTTPGLGGKCRALLEMWDISEEL